MYKLTDDKIEQFLVESSIMKSYLIDDGPPTFYKSFKEYKTNSKAWLDDLYKELGWKIIDYMIRKNAHDPGYDYELRYRALGAVSYLDSGVKSGNKNAIGKYKKRMEKNLAKLGWNITAWLGLDAAYDSLIGTVLSAGVGKTTVNQDDLEETFSKEWWKKELLNEDWWSDLDKSGQEQYIKDHPKSQKALDAKKKAKPVVKTKPKKDTSWMKGKDGWEILDSENVEVVKTKPYSDEQAMEETGEYFGNKKTKKAVPGLAKNRKELVQKIKDAPEETFSSQELENMDNTDAGKILDASEDGGIDGMKAKGKALAKKYKKGWDYITKNIESGVPQEAPIAVRDEDGELYLMAGNTRLMSNTAYGRKIPIKVIDYDGKFKYNEVFSPKWWKKESILIEGMTLEEGVKFNNFLKDWAKKGKQPLDKVRKTMMNKNTFSIAKLNNFSVDKVFEMAKKGFKGYQKIVNYVPNKIAKKLSQTKFGQAKEKYLVKLDDYLKEHPKLKRVMGIGAAAAVTYAWTKMTFIGDPEYDLDLSAVASAAALGEVSFADLFSGEMGTKFLVLTAVGAATGLTAPYVKAFGRVGTMAAGISFGAYRAYKARKQKKADTEKKAKTSTPDTVKNPNPKGRKKTISRQSAVRWVAKTKGNKAAIKYAKSLQEGILLEGGAAGHMDHPFDDSGLTFGDFKQIIKIGLSGKLDREDDVTEKLDGQNLLVSWKDDKLIAARNKGQLKGFGANALDVNGVASKFAGRGNIKDAFVFAMKDLQKAIKGLSQAQKDKVFGEGKRWMNLEVMYPASANVINYDGAYLVFHNATEYNKAGIAKKTDASLARILEGMIRQVNQHVQKKFTISKPQFLKVSKSQDFAKRQKYFLSKLQKLQNIYNLKDTDTLGKHHEMYWMEYIYNASKQMKYNIPNNVLNSLTKRWAFTDKSFRLNNKVIKHEEFLDWAKSTDKKDMKRLQKDNIKPFETLFFELGAEILKNVSGFLAANPKQTVSKMKREVDVAIKQLRSAKDVSKLDTLKRQLEKFEALGGSEAIVPSEGIVFKYKNKMYKFTGAFAPINQILGLLTFG